MDDVNLSISKHLKSGKYYRDARTWYVNKHLTPIAERSYIMIFFSLYCLALLTSIFFYVETNPAPLTVGYISSVKDISKYYSTIKATGDSKEDPQTRIDKYMLTTYVIKRESYAFESIKEQLSYIKSTTTKPQYLEYKNKVSINNPLSPVMQYQNVHTRSIQVQKVKILNPTSNIDNSLPGTKRAVVYFNSTVKNLTTNKTFSQDFVATISFKVDNIELSIEQQSDRLGFLVLDYNLNKSN